MNILIISPERYQDFYTSKIHIANHLKKKHKVFFLNPYASIKQDKILDEKLSGIHIINILSINFLSKFFDLKKHYVKMINNRVSKIDMIWCFDTNRANLLEDLDSKTKLFHLTDNFINKKSIEIINQNSDCILSVSKKLIKGFSKKKTFIVGHFIMKSFLNTTFKIKTNKIVAISGNFHMKEFNSKLLKKLVIQNKQITFFLVGPLLKKHFRYKLKFNKERVNDLNKIIKNKNVKVCGVLNTLNLIKLYKEINCFCIFYKKIMDNSHKILEFFSTGYPIISNSKFLSFKDKYFTMMSRKHTNKNELYKLIESKNFKENKYLYKKKLLVKEKTYDKLIETVLMFSKHKKLQFIKKIEIREVI
ncbi:hypothetical protein N8937_03230 [Candidatus Pelagibacter ubique]|nr:hypothetical protein [Candidatus Pelagibacter ubique]